MADEEACRGLGARFSRTRSDIERYRAGDRAAFDELWLRYRPALEILAFQRIGSVRNAHVRARLCADDVIQETGIRAIRKLREFEYLGPSSLYCWFDTVVDRIVRDQVDRWESDKRDLSRETAAVELDPDGLAPPETTPGPATSTEREELRARITKAVGRLSARQRRIVMLRYYFGAEWSEIAHDLGSPSSEAVRKEHAKMLPSLGSLLRRL